MNFGRLFMCCDETPILLPTWFPRALGETSRCLLYDGLIPRVGFIIRDVFLLKTTTKKYMPGIGLGIEQ